MNATRFIKDEFETMQAFLRAAEVRKEKDELVKVWANQVRDLAYDIEDCLEEFSVHIQCKSLLCRLMKLRYRHRIAIQIRSLKLRVEEVSNRNMRYNLLKSIPSTSMEESNRNVEAIRYQAAHYIDEAELVGFVGPKNDVLDLISNSASSLVEVIWIVGAGGLGKTTLAKKVYESSQVSDKFTCCAWVTVSQVFSIMELMKEMIHQLLGPESLKMVLDRRTELILNESCLADHLKNGLKEKRYFLVLDDLWTVEAWDCIKPTFWGNNNHGSRVVVTTRNGDLAVQSNSSLTYKLNPLGKEDATSLLLRKTGISLGDIRKGKMEETFDKIIKKCGGLPLAIVTIGSILATTNLSEWETLYNQLPSELEVNPSLEAMRKVILMSYNHLPSHLKPCFLYLSIFPEDFEIHRRRLVDRWIAEGFVGDRSGMCIEDIGDSYFDELISRSMIQPSKVNIGVVKSCQVHDITRDIMVSISREENFVLVAGDNNIQTSENMRHASIHGNECSNICLDWGHVRSLTFFVKRPLELETPLYLPQLKMLRTLDLVDAEFISTQKI
jgi:disease resistance protein RPM1